MTRCDILMDGIESKLRSFKKIEKKNATEQEEERMDFKITKIHLHVKKKEEDKVIVSNCIALKVKLPKSVIVRFNNTHINWFRFWNQFESEIDRSKLSANSKCSYHKELVCHKVRFIINGLPFTSEGSLRAKNILISKYGKLSEVNNAHIQNIILLFYINSVNLFNIHEFTQKLLRSIQARETMGKLKEINI